jgi:F0F1-type ATP synthase epsilon subunit
VADNRVSILARQATLGDNVDKVAVRAELDETLGAAQASQGSEPAEAGYLRAQLRAAGDEA